jgi:conjugal transfer/entry exclusion protein
LSLPKYRLQPVLDKRQKIKEDAEKALGVAQKKVDEEKKKEEECIQGVNLAKQRKEDAKAEMNRKMLEENLEVGKIRQHKDYLKSLDYEIKKAEERLEEQKNRVKAAEQIVIQKRNDLVEATKEYQAIEKHKENWAAALKKAMDEAEQKEAEEVGNVLFLQRKKESG